MPPLMPSIDDQLLLQMARCKFLVRLDRMRPALREGAIRAAACGLISEREAEMLRDHYRCGVRNA